MRSVIVAAVILTCFESALFAGGEHVRMTIAGDGIASVPVLVNGQGPFPFVIDTGTNRSLVGADLAAALELPIVARTEVIGVTGREYRPVVQLTASIGTSPAVSLMASIVPAAKLRPAAGEARGIIGQDLLMTLNYTLDYRRQRFTLSISPDRDPSSVEVPLEVEEGRLVLVLPPTGGQRAVRLVPDSGSTMFIVFDRGGQPPFVIESMSGAMQVGTLKTARSAPMVRLREVRLKTLTLRDQIAALIQRSDATGAPIDGLLPLQMFASVAIDMEERRMILTPQP
jgi:aspartyl protease